MYFRALNLQDFELEHKKILYYIIFKFLITIYIIWKHSKRGITAHTKNSVIVYPSTDKTMGKTVQQPFSYLYMFEHNASKLTALTEPDHKSASHLSLMYPLVSIEPFLFQSVLIPIEASSALFKRLLVQFLKQTHQYYHCKPSTYLTTSVCIHLTDSSVQNLLLTICLARNEG